MNEQEIELIRFLSALTIPAVVGLLTMYFTNRHNQRQAAEDRNHQTLMDRETATRGQQAQRYEERRRAYATLVNVSTALADTAIQRDHEGELPPEMYLDGPELADTFKPLNEALNEVLMIGTAETRKAAEELAKRTQTFVWSQDGYRDLDSAIIRFRVAARGDLGIEASGEDHPTEQPPGRVTRRRRK